LDWHGLIPEEVPVTTNVTTKRPGFYNTPLGSFQFHHVKTELFWGYREARFEDGQVAFIADPEKALLDLCYLTPGADSLDYIRELRVDPDGIVDPGRLLAFTERIGSVKLTRFANRFIAWLGEERAGRSST